MSSGGIGPDGKVYCKHMEEAARRRSNTPKHPNREFYCCKRPQSDPAKCNFWYWADQVPRVKHDLVRAPSSSAVQSPASSPPKGGGTKIRPVVTPPTGSPQKHFSPSKHLSEIPRNTKRLEDIETGLRQREQDVSPTRHQASQSKEAGPSTASPSTQTIPQPPSPAATEVDFEVETRPQRSFLGLEYSPEPTTSVIREEGQPSTPKKRRMTPPIQGIVAQPATSEKSFGDGVPLTPPQTTRRVAQSDRPEPVSVMSRGKGKEREGVTVQTQEQGDYSGEPQEEDSLPLFTLPGDISSTSSVSPTIAENVLDYTDGMKARVKALSEYMNSFDITQAAKLLQTIERQKIQYECRDRSQKMRIEELVTEKDRLVSEVSRLKEALQRCRGCERCGLGKCEDGYD